MLFTGVQIVIHAVDASGFQTLGLVGIEQSQAGADLEVILGLDFGDNRFHGLHFAFIGPAS